MVLEGTSIVGVERLEESLIGRNARVTRGRDNRRSLRLILGDYSEVML